MSGVYDISITIVRAEGLRAADSNGKSDPYVSFGRLTPGAQIRKTKVIQKTLDPVWNERASWDFSLSEQEWTIGFDVYDKDLVGKDFLGHAEIDLKKELMKEKKEYVQVVLELGPGPKTSEKEAKKITGKLHLTVNYPLLLLLDDESRTKIETRLDVPLERANAFIAQFREVSGGSDTIDDKKKMAKLVDWDIFKLIIILSATDDMTGFTREIVQEIVTDADLVDYFSRVMLVITGCQKEGVITLPNYVLGYSLVSRALTYTDTYQSNPNRDAVVFALVDMDGDGAISFDDLMAYHAFSPIAVQRKMEAEFLKDPKVAALKGKIGLASYQLVISDMYKKFKYPDVLRTIVIGMTVKVTAETYNLVDIKYTPGQFFSYIQNEAKRREVRAGTARDITRMMKDHNNEAQTVLNGALRKHGIN